MILAHVDMLKEWFNAYAISTIITWAGPKKEFHTKMISRQVNLQDFLEFLALFLSLGVLLLGVVAVLTQASRISSSPVSYISESVVAHPLDDTLCLLESD